MSEALDDEFDSVAAWTAEAVLDLGPEHALPAGCRGSGTPASLDWLIHQLALSSEVRLLDSGAGVGGPAEYAARATGATPLLVEPSLAACRAAARLFGRAVVVGEGAALPCADETFGAAWSVGVLCTVPDKGTHLDEIVRVLVHEGRLGLLVYERTIAELPEQPEGNSFPSAEETDELVRRAGLDICATAHLSDFPSAPDEWLESAARVDTWIEDRYADTAAWQRAEHQQSTIRSLIESGHLVGRMVVARKGS